MRNPMLSSRGWTSVFSYLPIIAQMETPKEWMDAAVAVERKQMEALMKERLLKQPNPRPAAANSLVWAELL